MNFLKLFLYLLSNQKGELNLGGGEESEDEGIESMLEGLDDDQPEDEDFDDEGQPDEEPKDVETMLSEMDAEGGDEAKLLEEINALNVLHDGLPVDFENMEQIKELLSKGFDYTKKTQDVAEQRKQVEAELANERQAIQAERAKFEEETKQHEQILTEYKTFEAALLDIQRKDPDLLAEIQDYYRNHEGRYDSNPVNSRIESQLKEIQDQLSRSKETETQAQHETIRKEWETQLTDIQKSFGPKLRKLGVRPNWKRVQDTWSSDSSGKMTVKQALFAEYGEQIEKSMANMTKLSDKRAKTKGLTPDKEEDNSHNLPGNDYQREALEIAKML